MFYSYFKHRTFFFYSLCLTLVLFLPGANGFEAGKVGKYPEAGKTSGDQVVVIPEAEVRALKCIRDCVHRNRMVAVGYRVIEADCRRECEFREALTLLHSPNAEERIRGVEKLDRLGDRRAVPHLIRALKKEFDERTGLSAWIIPALGHLKDPEAVPVLVEALKIRDEDWLGREKAAVALGEIGDPSAIPALIDASERYETRQASIEALAGFRDKRAIPVLLAALVPEEDMATRDAAMAGLRRLGKLAVPELIKAFSRYSPEYPETMRRVWLCELLAESGDEEAIKRLRESLNDPDKAVRNCVSEHLQGK